MKKAKITAYVDAALFDEIDELAARRRVPKTQIIEAALASFLSPDSAEQSEAAIVRRLDRLTRSLERLERDHNRGAGAVCSLLADHDAAAAR